MLLKEKLKLELTYLTNFSQMLMMYTMNIGNSKSTPKMGRFTRVTTILSVTTARLHFAYFQSQRIDMIKIPAMNPENTPEFLLRPHFSGPFQHRTECDKARRQSSS